MKDLRKLYSECVTELKHINMDISDRITEVKSNGRLRTVLGKCKYNRRTGNYTIEINTCLLEDKAETQAAKETIIHELIHTCPNCMNHGYEWKRRGDRASRMLGYHVERLAKIDKLETQGVKVKQEEYKYACKCNKCGKIFSKRKRWSNTLENIENYTHGGCGGSLTVISLDGRYAIASAANGIKTH